MWKGQLLDPENHNTISVMLPSPLVLNEILSPEQKVSNNRPIQSIYSQQPNYTFKVKCKQLLL